MKSKLWAVVALTIIACLGWQILELAIENDGLRQVIAGQKRSVEILLNYAKIASQCDVSPEQVAKILGSSVLPTTRGEKVEVAYLEFRAEFDKRGLSQVEIVGVGKVDVCETSSH